MILNLKNIYIWMSSMTHLRGFCWNETFCVLSIFYKNMQSLILTKKSHVKIIFSETIEPNSIIYIYKKSEVCSVKTCMASRDGTLILLPWLGVQYIFTEYKRSIFFFAIFWYHYAKKKLKQWLSTIPLISV